jgi:hypothetical protein
VEQEQGAQQHRDEVQQASNRVTTHGLSSFCAGG